jgi:hypothetical protein
MKTVIKTYSGKSGKCMCGCAGNYNYVAEKPRGAAIIAKKVLSNPAVVYEDNYAYVDNGARILVAYFAE